jgi:DNA-directed RNA polymerase specialized sigma24 family protein
MNLSFPHTVKWRFPVAPEMIPANKMAEWILESSLEEASGRELMQSAERTWPRVLAYALQELPANLHTEEKTTVALELWEKILRSVAGTIQRQSNHIVEMDAYLTGIFKHRLHRMLARERRRGKVLAFVPPEDLIHHENTTQQRASWSPEDEIQIKEIIHCMDNWMKEVWAARVYGYSWQEISQLTGLTEPQTKMRFRYALSKIRDRLLKRVRK